MALPEQKPRDLSSLRIHRPEDGERRRGISRVAIGWLVAVSLAIVVGMVVYERWIAPRSYPLVETTLVKPTLNVPDQTLLSATGYLVADRQANISAKVSGRVVQILVDTGSKVVAGQTLAIVESDELKAQLQEADAAYQEASRAHARQQALYREGVASRSLLEDSEARMRISGARKLQAEINVRDSVIRAPFAGTVVARNSELGEMVSSVNLTGIQTSAAVGGGSIATIADLDTIEVEADVNESNLSKIVVGQPAEISVDALPGQKLQGRLRKVIPAADRAKGVVKVRVSIDQKNAALLPDMSSAVTFLQAARTAEQLQERPRIWVPASAVLSDAAGARVMVVSAQNTIVVRRVELGQSREDRAEVRSGLREGERIVTSDPEKLTEGQRVKVGP